MKPIEVGRVVKPHGLGGEVKVRLHWAESGALLRAPAVRLVRDGEPERELAVEAVRSTARGVLLKLAGVDDCEAAEALRGARVTVAREALPPLAPGEYYLSDLVGATVVGPSGEIGRVTAVRTHPSVDCLVIRLSDGQLAEQPLTEPWILRVDVGAGRVELTSTEALIGP